MPPPLESQTNAAPSRRVADGSASGNGGQRLRNLSVIRTLALEMGEAGTTEDAMDAMLATIERATGWAYSESWLIEDGMATACVSRNRIGESLHDFASIFAGTRLVATEGLPGLAVQSGKAVWIEDLSSLDPGTFLRRTRGIEAGFVGAAVLPMVSQNEVQGVISFFLRSGEMPDPREQRVIENVVMPLGDLLRHQRIEDELRQRDHELERRLDESRARVERLVEEVREAERWSTVGTFAAGVVHDLTNSLFPLRCRSDLLRQMDLPDAAREHVEAIDAAISYLDRLAANLRSLCRGNGTGSRSEFTACLSTWWRDHRRLVQGQLGSGVALHAILAPELPPIHVGEDCLTRMVFNLADNASKALDGEGSVVVTVAIDTDDRFVRLCVADDGPGLTPIQRRRAFSLQPRDREGVGSNFGLAMVRSLVEQAGGCIELDSTEGHGTRISLLLPVADAAMLQESPCAVHVSLQDARLAGMVVELFRVLHGGRVDLGAPESASQDAEILVLDRDAASLPHAQRFIEGSPRRQVLAIGVGDSWTGVRATVVADPLNAGTLRDGVQEVVTEQALARPLTKGRATW
jgi:signal transduction histidine kinase